MSRESGHNFNPEESKPKKSTSKKGKLAGALLGLGLSFGSAQAQEAGELPSPDETKTVQRESSPQEELPTSSITFADLDRKRSDEKEHETLSKIADMTINTLDLPRYIELVEKQFNKKKAGEMIQQFKETLEAEKDPEKRMEMAKMAVANLKVDLAFKKYQADMRKQHPSDADAMIKYLVGVLEGKSPEDQLFMINTYSNSQLKEGSKPADKK